MTEEARWLPLVAVADVPESGLAFTFPSGPFTEGGILIRTGTGVRAWLNRCRHLSVPLDHDAPGEFLTGDRRHLVCGKHGVLYRSEDGLCVAGPCRVASLRPLRVAVRQGKVCLDTTSLPDPLAGLETP